MLRGDFYRENVCKKIYYRYFFKISYFHFFLYYTILKASEMWPQKDKRKLIQMDNNFNRYNRYSDEFDQNGNDQPPVTPKGNGTTKSQDQLRSEYEKRDQDLRKRLEQRNVTKSKVNNTESKKVNSKTSSQKVNSKTSSQKVILKENNLKEKKSRRGKIVSCVAAILVLCVALGLLGNVGYKKMQSGEWLDVNFMIEPTAELDYDKIKSEYVYLYNVDENRGIAGQKANEKMYPASLTKMMTAIVAIEEAGNPANLNDTVKVPKYIMDRLIRENASIAGFAANEEVSYMDLLYGVLLPSGGDACLTIADQMFGSEEAMVEKMNEKAKKLHMDGTHFVNTVGLHDPNHYSTPKDMAKLMKYGLKNETFKKIISTEEYTSSVTPEHPQGILMKSTVFKKIETTKKIEEKYGSLVEDDGYYADDGFYDPSSQYAKEYETQEPKENKFLGDNDLYIKGGKTGYTLEAQLCLASYGEVDGKEYILITGKAYGNPHGEPFNMYDDLYVYGQVHKAHLAQQEYIEEKLWRRVYVDIFGKEA